MQKPSVDILSLLVELLAEQEGVKITYETRQETHSGTMQADGKAFFASP